MPQKFVNLENLTSFWGNAKEYIGNERKEIEDQLYNWQKTEKAPVVQCEPVPNSDLHPIVDFMFTETGSASEDKAPDNPSTITGVSSVKVTRCGKNLIKPISDLYSRTINGITFTVNGDGTFILNGTATANITYYICTSGNSSIKLKKGNTYTFTGCPAGGSTSMYYLRSVSDGIFYQDSGNGFTFSRDEDGFANCFIGVNSGVTVSNLVFKPQLELGSAATSFESYSGSDYTIQLGDTYYGGSIDLSTGLMTVTQQGFIFDGSENWTSSSGQFLFSLSSANNAIWNAYSSQKCTHYQLNASGTVDDSFRLSAYYIYIKTSGTLESFKNFLASQYANGTPVVVTYALLTPFTVQLTPTQIKSLASLEGTSKRTNTLYTDADSIQVEYQKYVGVDSTLDNTSENAIQNKVVNSALNTKVSLTGDEVIAGSKTFSSPINGSVTGDAGTVAGHIVSKDVPVNASFTDTTYEPATQSTAGLMSASDKVKLDAVGSVFSFKGSVTDSSSLPASDNVNGDAYLAEDTGHVHVYDGSSFVDIGTWAGIPSATDAQIDALFED